MKLAIIGAGQLGQQLFDRAANAQKLIIDSRGTFPDFCHRAELGCSSNLKDAASCDVVALAVPPAACQSILETICPLLQPGTIILNFPTKYLIPEEMKTQYPQLHLLESKLLGSAVGLSIGLPHRVILNTTDKMVAETVTSCLGGLNFTLGDHLIVPKINNYGMKAALQAAMGLEQDLLQQGYEPDVIQAAVGGLMAGSIVSYAAGTLGEFGLDLVEEIKNENK